jgi:hypothetical protein
MLLSYLDLYNSYVCVKYLLVAVGGLMVIVLAIGPKVRGFTTGEGRCIFKGDTYPLHDFVRRRSKAVSPR